MLHSFLNVPIWPLPAINGSLEARLACWKENGEVALKLFQANLYKFPTAGCAASWLNLAAACARPMPTVHANRIFTEAQARYLVAILSAPKQRASSAA